MKKICYVVSSLKSCGPTNQLYNIVKYLPKDEYKINVVCLIEESDKSNIDKFKRMGVNVVFLGLNKKEAFVRGYSEVCRVVKEVLPDILHSQGYIADLICFVLRIDVIKLITIRNNPDEDYPSLFGAFMGRFIAYTHYYILRKSHVVACSKSLKRILGRDYGVDSVAIQNGYEKKYLDDVYSIKLRIRKRHCIRMDSVVFIVVGSLIPRKNVGFVLDCFKNSYNDFYLIVLGDGYLLDKLRVRFEGCQNIIFAGYKKDVDEYYIASDVYISASFSEGLPNTVLEAYSYGLPCVLSDIEQHREIQQGVDDNCFYYHDNFDASLIKAIDSVVADRGEQQRQHGRSLGDFDACYMSAQYKKYYDLLLVN